MSAPWASSFCFPGFSREAQSASVTLYGQCQKGTDRGYEMEFQPAIQKARQFLKSAKLLKDVRGYDSSASRLYYAMFYCAEALLFSKGLTFSNHQAVISAFGQHFAKTNEMPVEMHR
jgi:uncharacterized protein (UPF0332 family)